MKSTLVFLPGLGADHRLFKHQTAAFPEAYAADWIDPLPCESLEQYAVRFAASIRAELDRRPPAPVVVCGLSLGGMIAPYVARELGAVGTVLLCTIRGPEEFPRRYYPDWLLMRLCPPLRPFRLFLAQCGARLLLLCPCLFRRVISPKVIRQFAETPTRRLAGLSRMMFDWAYRSRAAEAAEVSGPVLPSVHVHGTRDPLLPIGLTSPDIRIEGGRHLLAISHPGEVNEIIRRFVEDLERKARSTG